MNNMLQQLLDAAPDAILAADSDGIIRYWNLGAEQLFGHTTAAAVGQSLDLIIPEKLRERHWEGYRRVMATGETRYKTGLLTSPGTRSDNSRISLEFSIVLLKDADGAIQGCGTVMRDVSRRWQRERELQAQLAACEARLATSA